MQVSRTDGHVVVEAADDGVGGADQGTGSGLRRLADRVDALGGTLELVSPRALERLTPPGSPANSLLTSRRRVEEVSRAGCSD